MSRNVLLEHLCRKITWAPTKQHKRQGKKKSSFRSISNCFSVFGVKRSLQPSKTYNWENNERPKIKYFKKKMKRNYWIFLENSKTKKLSEEKWFLLLSCKSLHKHETRLTDLAHFRGTSKTPCSSKTRNVKCLLILQSFTCLALWCMMFLKRATEI